MEHPPTIFITPEPPPMPAPPRRIELAPLEFVLALIAIVTIPALIYTFFYSIKCPPSPFRSRRRDSTSSDADTDSTAPLPPPNPPEKLPVADVKYRKESHAKEIGIECPVCLSCFSDGEEVKQLSVCKHSFHAPCIDLWLNSHSNCPVCRATVVVKHPPPPAADNGGGRQRRGGDQVLHQGLPDAGSLV